MVLQVNKVSDKPTQDPDRGIEQQVEHREIVIWNGPYLDLS